MEPTDAMEPTKKVCGAATKSGATCKRPAGAGTSHRGYGHCSKHTGSTPGGEKAAAQEQAREVAAQVQGLVGPAERVDLDQGLLTVIARTAQESAFFSARIAELDSPTVSTMFGPQLHMWVTERQKADKRLVEYIRVARTIGIAERQIALAEQYGEAIVRLIHGILDELELSPEQMARVPEVTVRQLAAVTGVEDAA